MISSRVTGHERCSCLPYAVVFQRPDIRQTSGKIMGSSSSYSGRWQQLRKAQQVLDAHPR